MPQQSQLSEAKRKLLDRYLRGKLFETREIPSIPVRARGEHAPLTLAQEQIWVRAQASTGLVPFYNECLTVHRTGPVEVAALEQSVAELIRRHEIWRTTFDCLGGHPMQVVHPAPNKIAIPFFDLRSLPNETREAESVRIAEVALRTPFDLSKDSLLRFTLVRLDDLAYRLYVAIHQIIIDGVSAYEVFLPELVTLYEAYANGKPSPLAEPPIQYGDFADWQRNHFSRSLLSQQIDYWRKQLSGEIPRLNWPRPGPLLTRSTHRGRIYPFILPKALNDQAKALSRRYNVTLFATLFGAFTALLHSYTQQPVIIVGTVTPAGRDRCEVQHLMGYFLNPVAIRTSLRDDPTFAELLVRTLDSIVGALGQDDVPYEEVVQAVVPHAASDRNPLFNVAASLEPLVPDCGSGWDLTPMDIESGGTRWDLYFVWEDRPQGITGRVQYCTEVFDQQSVARMIEDFECVLDVLTRCPAMRMSDVARLVSTRSPQVLR